MSVAPALAGDTIYQGAAHIIISKPAEKAAWKYIWAEGEVTVRLVRPEADVNVAGFGPVFSPVTDETIEVSFTPASQVDATILAFLYGSVWSAMPGASWFGSSDTPVWIHTMAGRILGITNCRPTTFPAINFGHAPKRFDGSVTLTGVLKRGTARTAVNALFTPWAAEPFTAAPEEDEFPNVPCAVSWSLIADTVIEGMAVWKLTPQIQLAPRTVANLGTIDYTVQSVAMEASCVPANLLEANLWAEAAIGESRALGTSVAGGDLTLLEDNPGLTAVLSNARLVQAPTRFDPANPIAGQCVWRSRRKTTAGAWSAAGTLAMTAAD